MSVAIIVGKIMSLAEELPAASLKPIIVVGKSWIDVTFIITSIIILAEATPLLSSSISIAFIPAGVAAFPSPNIFADRLRAIIFSVSGSFTFIIFLFCT